MRLLDAAVVRPFGETAVVLELGEGIDEAVHAEVLAAERAVLAAAIAGVEETVPTYRSLLLRIDPLVTNPEEVVAALGRLRTEPAAPAPVVHDVEVSFAGADAEDLDDVAALLGLTPDDVVVTLTATPLRLYLYGFAPGFAYLGGVPAALHVPRRTTPRAPVRPGSVLLAAGQAALCPTAMPTGWYVVGRTDAVLFDPTTSPPVPFAVGDRLRLVPT